MNYKRVFLAIYPKSGILALSMEIITNALPWIQIALSILLIASVVLQQSAAGLGGALGGSDASVTFHTRRGFEKILFYSTIILGILFVAAGLLAVFL